MSTKTIKQRIAVVAVSALTAGLFSVVSAPVANAALTDNTMYVGANSFAAEATLTTADSGVTGTPDARSVGLLASSGSGTTRTATLMSNGTLVLVGETNDDDAGDQISFVVQGGTVDSSVVNVTTAGFIGSARNYSVNAIVAGTSTDGHALATAFKPSAGATTMIVQMYTGTDISATSPLTGTLRGQIVVTIATTALTGVASASKSDVYYATSGDRTLSADAASASTVNNGVMGYINLQVDDAYGDSVTSTSGALVVTATNNAIVNINTAGAAIKGTASTAVTNLSPADVSISVAQPTANAPVSTTVTITYNGTLIGSKSFTIKGEVAKVTVTEPGIGKLNGTTSENAGVGVISLTDSAGNKIYPTAASAIYPTGNLTIDPDTDTTTVPTLAITTEATSSAAGKIGWSCGADSGSSQIKAQYVNPSGTTIKSDAFKASCAGAAYNYTASWDKASYTPGSVATLVVTVKDSDGFLSNDIEDVSSAAFTYTGAPSTVVAGSASTDNSSLGVLKFTFIAGTTEGDFAAVVSNSALNTASGQVAVSSGYSIKASSTAVTMADVLKSVVSLIASINKQIQALQKLILKR